MVLPCRLSPFEFYMLRDDRETHPMAFTLCLDLEGQLDADAMANAVRDVMPRHPMLTANIVCGRAGHLEWRAATDSEPTLDVAKIPAPCRYPESEQIDLTAETGLRVWIRYDSAQCRLVFQFHHACCDGLGGYTMIEDVLCRYDQIVSGDESSVEMRQIDPHALSQRSALPSDSRSLRERISRNLSVVPRRLLKFFLTTPAPIRIPPPADPHAATGPLEYLSHCFSRHQTKALRKQAVERGGSSTQVLLRDLFLTVRDWNAHRGGEGGEMFRIAVPVSMRNQIHDRISASNVVSVVSIQRRADQIGAPDDLLDDLVSEFDLIRRWQIDRLLLQVAGNAKKVPMIASLLHRRSERCHASSSLSSVGKVFSRSSLRREKGKILTGKLRLQRVSGAPPIRPQGHVSVGCTWYAGRLDVSLNYDTRSVSVTDATEILAKYVERIYRSMQLPDPAPAFHRDAKLSMALSLS